MNDYDADTTEVQDALRDSLGEVTMGTPVEQIMATGRTRLRHRRVAGVAAGAVAVTGLALGVGAYANPSAAPPKATGGVHIQTVAYTVDSMANGTVQVTWDKQRYFEDREGLQAALRKAGFPVLIKVGEFCRGPQDSGTLDPSGTGPGLDRVVRGEQEANGRVVLVFTPSAMPAGMQLFIGYLNSSQLAVTHGAPGSVERLVPIGVPLTCTTVAPPPHIRPGSSAVPPRGK
jgi:hypothetical protein